MSRRAPLLLALPAVLGLLHPTAQAEPPDGTTPAPAAAAGALEAVLDELAARVRQLDREAGAAAEDEEALRRQLTAARGRIAELEAARATDAATIAELRAELEGSRAEARALDEQLAAARQGLERLNAVLAAAAAGRGAAEGGDGTSDREAGAGSSSAPPASPPAGDPAAGGGSDGAPAGVPAYYAATNPVNLRAAPQNGAEVLAVIGAGERVRRIGRDGGWLRVRYTNRFATDVTGWVHGDFLRSTEPRANG